MAEPLGDAVPPADALGEALALAAGRILAEVFAVLVELADGVACRRRAPGHRRRGAGRGARARPGNRRIGRPVGLVQQHLAEHEQRRRAHQLDRLLRALAGDRHDEQVRALRLDLRAGVAGAVDPRLDDADRGVHLIGRRRLPGQGLRPQGHLGPAGQVKTESYLEPVLPLARGEQLRAEYAQQHGHDEDQQKHEGPSRMRDGSRWGCHFSACLRSAVSRKPSCRTAAQCTLSLSDLARSS